MPSHFPKLGPWFTLHGLTMENHLVPLSIWDYVLSCSDQSPQEPEFCCMLDTQLNLLPETNSLSWRDPHILPCLDLSQAFMLFNIDQCIPFLTLVSSQLLYMSV